VVVALCVVVETAAHQFWPHHHFIALSLVCTKFRIDTPNKQELWNLASWIADDLAASLV
jgi:hypothetical protein